MTTRTYTVKVFAVGTRHWYLNGELHREDGPANERHDGTRFWYLNGKIHREDGPAVEYADGTRHWYLNDEYLTKAEFLNRTQKKLSCDGRVVEIDGVKYKLTAV